MDPGSCFLYAPISQLSILSAEFEFTPGVHAYNCIFRGFSLGTVYISTLVLLSSTTKFDTTLEQYM